MATIDDQWQLGIGDPTPLGWITVAAYALAALACWRCHSVATRRSSNARFWLGISIAMALLGINKQLDLQSALTALGRWLALTQGWYARRHGVQLVFISAIAGTGLLVLAGMLRMAWPPSAGRALALCGLVFLAVFVLVRAASFHHVDLLLNSAALGLRWNGILELGGIACVTLGALLDTRSAR
jgi:hypothetical protein